MEQYIRSIPNIVVGGRSFAPLIRWMLAYDPDMRPTAQQVIDKMNLLLHGLRL